MNKKFIIGFIIALIVLIIIWSEMNAPVRQARPVQNAKTQAEGENSLVDEIGHSIICPDSACTAQGITIAHSNCETATMLRSQIAMMLQRGLTREGVNAHLRMLGLLPGDPGLPEGHPPMGGTMGGGTSDTSTVPGLPEGHPPIPHDHPPMKG